jgi:hypothetical protein
MMHRWCDLDHTTPALALSLSLPLSHSLLLAYLHYLFILCFLIPSNLTNLRRQGSLCRSPNLLPKGTPLHNNNNPPLSPARSLPPTPPAHSPTPLTHSPPRPSPSHRPLTSLHTWLWEQLRVPVWSLPTPFSSSFQTKFLWYVRGRRLSRKRGKR